MSDTALLSEVRANLPYRLALKAADQVFSGDHGSSTRTFRRSTSTAATAAEVRGRRHRTSTHQSEHHAGGRGGGGHSALDEAKNIVDESLKKTHRGGKGRNSRNRRSTSGDGDLTALRSKVEWLVDENEKLHEEVASLRQLVEKQTVESVLLLGDGNFSFAVAFARTHPRCSLRATVLEADEGDSQSTRPNCRPNSTENSIGSVMNFPHQGGKSNLRHSRRLLAGIFASVARILGPSACFELALTSVQTGLNLRSFTRTRLHDPPAHQKDSWQPAYLAAESGLLLRAARRFRPPDGYRPSGYLSRDQHFHAHTGVVLEFRAVRPPSSLREAVRLEADRSEAADPSRARFSTFAPVFRHDISVLFADNRRVDEWERRLLAIVDHLAAPLVRQVDEVRELRWRARASAAARSRSAAPAATKKDEKPAAATEKAEAKDEDFDLTRENDAEKERVKQERLKAYAEKKAKKPGPIAKSNIIYDVKPWGDEVDLKELEQKIRDEIQMDGLVWGAAKVLPIAYGINKLQASPPSFHSPIDSLLSVQIMCVVEDDKVSSDDLEEKITDMEDYVQSIDVVAFNKV
ncbi:Elongation factor 1-beta [Aphelenchoides fujianensis]|nr:Elongation factor 1-beta [Aphelenchoides fujianensis]